MTTTTITDELVAEIRDFMANTTTRVIALVSCEGQSQPVDFLPATSLEDLDRIPARIWSFAPADLSQDELASRVQLFLEDVAGIR